MITIKQNRLKCGLSLLLVLAMITSMFSVNTYAAATELPSGYHTVTKISAPVGDGVYYADINLMNATAYQTSMGNAALRGSSNFLAKNPDDTDYSAIVVVKDGKATAIVEFMPMGYIGMYGFMMELEAVDAGALTKYGGVAAEYSTFTPAAVLSQHLTLNGEIVYDGYNNPNSEYVFDGSNPSKHTRPAGFGYDEPRLVNIADQPYSHILALDVTPVQIDGDTSSAPTAAEEFTQDNAAYVHVFVPVMFDISPSSGDQYAKMQVDWTTVEKIEDPTSVLQYQLWAAMQIEQEDGAYTSESYSALQSAIVNTSESLSNIWPSQELTLTGTGFNKIPELNMVNPDESALLSSLNAAINGLESIGDKKELNALITEANTKDESLYTAESFSLFSEKLSEAVKVQKNGDAGVSAVEKAVTELKAAMDALEYKPADYTGVQTAVNSIPADIFSICTEETAQAVQDAQNDVDWTLNIVEQSKVDEYASAIKDAISKLVYLGADYSKVSDAIAKIPDDLSLYTDETAQAVSYAQDAVDWTKDKTEQGIVDEYALAIEDAVSKLVFKPADYTAVDEALAKVPEDLAVYTDETADALNAAINDVVRGKDMSEKDAVEGYAKTIENAINALKYKSADYTAVDEAVSRIPSDLSVYTDETVQAVENAQANVDVNKNITEQEEVNAYAKAIEEAVNALEYKSADYSGVDIAIANVPFDLSVYTEESAKAVQDALDAVVRGKNITEQNAVDEMAEAINAAAAGLEKKLAALDKYNLEDGVYSIYGEMIKVNRQDKSMSNDAINHTIKLTVRDGKYYLTMDFHGLAYLNKFGYLAELSYYDNGYTYGLYGKIDGNTILAEVLSTQKNADGSDVIDEFNQPGGSSEGLLYPDQLEFPLVADALADPDGYVPLHVFVPVMEDISEGTGDQDVLLRLDWSMLEKTTEDDPAFKPEDPVEQSPAVDITDTATGVKIHADKGVFEEGVKLVVTPITSGTDYDKAEAALNEIGKNFKLYEIHFEDADGNEVQPNGTVTVSYPIPEEYNAENVVMYRINDDGSKTLIKGTVQDGYYVVIVKSFSNYALVEADSEAFDSQAVQTENTDETNSSADNPTNADTDNSNSVSVQASDTAPNTGDNSDISLWFVLALFTIGTLGAVSFLRRHKALKGE